MSQKLQGIYDALDHGNYKNALKLCATLLKKEPTHALCKALNAIALERCGRRDEALQLCEEAQAGTGINGTVLNTLQVVFRRCRQYSKITQMYDAAWTREPDNKEFAIALFSSAMRECDFVKAQQVATKLYRKFNVPKFMHWVVVSILLQAQRNKEAKVLNLAEMMLQKVPVEPLKVESQDGFDRSQQYLLLLHLTTLRLRGKSAEALEMLDTHKGYVPFETDVVKMRIQLLEEAGRHGIAAKEARALVAKDCGNWSNVQDCLRLAFRCPLSTDALPTLSWIPREGVELQLPDQTSRLRGPFGKEGEKVDATSLADVDSIQSEDEVWNIVILLDYLKHHDANSRTLQLAELELRRLAILANESAASSQHRGGDHFAPPTRVAGEEPACCAAGWQSVVTEGYWKEFIELIEDYLRKHGNRNYCYFDLKPFLCLFDNQQGARFCKVLEDACQAWEHKNAHAGQINIARLRRGFLRPAVDLESPAFWEAAENEVSSLLGKCSTCAAPAKEASQEDGGREPEASSKVLSEEFLILALMSLVDLDREHCRKLQLSGSTAVLSDRGYLLDALALAEMGLASLPHCYQFKVVSVLIYAALGLPAGVLKWYSSLEIKNIQHESLSFLALDALSASGCHDTVRELCRCIEQFHEDFEKDTNEAVHSSFQSGVYHRIPEYIDAQELMGRSIIWGRAVVEDSLATMGQSQTIEALMESMGNLCRQDGILEAVASKPVDWWVFRNQDRSVLQAWQPLPWCSPLAAEASHSSGDSWRNGKAVPSSLACRGRFHANNSAAAIWEPLSIESSPPPIPRAGGSSDISCCFKTSAVEHLLNIGCERSASQLKSAASQLMAIDALLHRDEKAMASAVQASRDSLKIDGIEPVEFEPSAASGTANATSDNASCRLALPWCTVPPVFASLVRQSALASVSAGHLVLQSLSSGQAWDMAERSLLALAAMVKSCTEAILEDKCSGDGESDSAGRSLLPMRHGMSMIWMFLNECLMVMIPVILWCTTIPKSSGKATRSAIKSLITGVQTALSELQGALGSAEKQMAEASKPPETQIAALTGFFDFERFREQVSVTLLDAHRKHLQVLKEAISMRLVLIKSKASFKP